MKKIIGFKIYWILLILLLVQICSQALFANYDVESYEKKINIKVLIPDSKDGLLDFALNDLCRCLELIQNYEVELVRQEEQIDSPYIIRVGTSYLKEDNGKKIGLQGFIIDTKNKGKGINYGGVNVFHVT